MEREGTRLLAGTFGATGNSQGATFSSPEATATSSNFPNSYPTCSRCRNHWLKIRVKGHKRYCKYRDCTCEKCSLVAEGQKISALRMAVWRAQAQDEAHIVKEISQQPEKGVTATHSVPSALDSGLKERIQNLIRSLHTVTSGRKQSSAVFSLGVDCRSTVSSSYSLSAGGTTLSTTFTTPVTCFPSLGESIDSLYSPHSSTAPQATALVVSGAPVTDSQALVGSGYLLSTGNRRLTAIPWIDSNPVQGCSYSMPVGSRMLPTASLSSDALWMDSRSIEWTGYTVSTGGTSLPTVSSAETNSSQFPISNNQVIQNCGSMTNVCYEMLLNQYYLNLRYLIKPS